MASSMSLLKVSLLCLRLPSLSSPTSNVHFSLTLNVCFLKCCFHYRWQINRYLISTLEGKLTFSSAPSSCPLYPHITTVHCPLTFHFCFLKCCSQHTGHQQVFDHRISWSAQPSCNQLVKREQHNNAEGSFLQEVKLSEILFRFNDPKPQGHSAAIWAYWGSILGSG